jgi:hypothetical protein
VIKILGIDPGRTTGLALLSLIEKELKPLAIRESRDLTCRDYLDLLQEADQIVIENFLIRPMKARTGAFDWSDMETPKVIGAIVAQLANLGKTPVFQEPSVKPPGYGLSNQHYVKGKKGLHIQDAIAHAVFFAVKNLGANPLKRKLT